MNTTLENNKLIAEFMGLVKSDVNAVGGRFIKFSDGLKMEVARFYLANQDEMTIGEVVERFANDNNWDEIQDFLENLAKQK